MSSFPSDEEFNQHVSVEQIADSAIKWGALPINVVYRMQKLPWISRYGDDAILQLVNHENKEVDVWAPQNVIIDYITKSVGENGEAYIRSLGQKVNDKKRKYFDFESVFISKLAKLMSEEDQKLRKVGGEKQARVTGGGKKRKAVASAPASVPELAAKNSKVDIDRLIDGSGIVIH